MIFTKEEMRFIRLYKTGLVLPYKNSYELLSRCDVQAQSMYDVLFNIKQRIKEDDIEKRIEEKSVIRNWTIRNTLHYLNIDQYTEVIKINNLLGNWFEKMYLRTDEEQMSYRNAKSIFKKEYLIDKEMLLANGVMKTHITNWQGIFIQLAKDGLLLSKDKHRYISTKGMSKNNIDITVVKVSELAARYFENYGPATLQDFCYWSGLKVQYARKFMDLLIGKFHRDEQELWYSQKDIELRNLFNKGIVKIPDCLILAKFDPICLSYNDKSWLLETNFKNKVWGPAGIVESIILLDGKIVATWRLKKFGIKIRMIKKLDNFQKTEIYRNFRIIFKKDYSLEFDYEY